MPGSLIKPQGPLQVLKIADFSAGIVSQNYSQTAVGRVPSINAQKISASANTYGVMSLPSGGLLLGPTLYNVATPSITLPSGMTAPFINGLWTQVSHTGSIDYTTWFTVCGQHSGDTEFALYAYNSISGPGTAISTIVGAALGSGGSNFPSFLQSTLLYEGGGPTPVETLVFGADPATNLCYQYNEPVGSIVSMGSSAYPITANGRVWGISDPSVSPSGLGLYNAINYTDPSDGTASNLTLGSQATIIDYDEPSTFGAWGTISSSEVMLIKASNGGVIVSGDIFNPTISRAPSVQGTRGLQGMAANTPAGVIYRSAYNGVWAWAGGASSSKISAQLSDAIWAESGVGTPPSAAFLKGYDNPQASTSTFFSSTYFNNMCFMDGGWFYQFDTGAWWKLPGYGSNTSTIFNFYPYFYAPRRNAFSSAGGATFDIPYFGLPGTGGSTAFAINQYAFDVSRTTPAYVPANLVPGGLVPYYGSFWESNPIQLGTDDMIEVQEIEFVIQGKGTLYCSIIPLGTVTTGAAFYLSTTISNNTFERVSFNFNQQTDVMVLQVGFTNENTTSDHNPATPIIESINIKWRSVLPIAKVN